ncbi:site-2 protease family protein [candidate division KSB1 bacterium]|nr:site-2 protease family protein [candidate division KSB1 bacterium]
MPDLATYLIMAPAILLALTFHEFAHAWVANRFGDPTARQMGRLTLNPIPHLDLMGTIMLFIVHFGWAKPVPVNPTYFKNPKKDLLWVSLAGPVSNLLLAFVFGMIWRMIGSNELAAATTAFGIAQRMVIYGIFINLILAFFNMIPVPPLDGSKILMGLLPPKYEPMFAGFMRYGHFVLLALILMDAALNIPVFGFLHTLVRTFSLAFAGMSFF